jgi:hypothetical protein
VVAARPGGQRARKFFTGRRPLGPLRFDHGEADDLIDYPNVSPRIGLLISHDKSLIGPLSTVLSIEDMYNLIEVISVDAHNDRILRERRDRDRE